MWTQDSDFEGIEGPGIAQTRGVNDRNDAAPNPIGRNYSGGSPSISNERCSSVPIGSPSRIPDGSLRTNHLS